MDSQISSLPIADAVALALRHLHDGRAADAESLCRRILEVAPQNAQALNLSGILACQAKRPDVGVQLFRRAIASQAEVAEFHNNLGNAHSALGNLTDALDSYVTALRINPAYVEVYDNLARVLLELHLAEPAEFIKGVKLGIALGRLAGNTARPVGIQPAAMPGAGELANFYYKLALSLDTAGALSAACSCLEAAAVWAPQEPSILNNLAAARSKVVRDIDALSAAELAVQRAPLVPEPHSNLATALMNVGRFDEAIPTYRRAIELGRDSKHLAKFWDGLGAALGCSGRLDEAVQACSAALVADPHNVRAHVNRSLLLLKAGQFTAGWEEYEWRHELAELRTFPWLPGVPRWHGDGLEGKTIVLLTEQGLGDSIHFVRYAPLLARRGARVVVVCEPELRRLIGSIEGVSRTCGPQEIGGKADFQCRMLSLPLGFNTTLGSIPGEVPYIKADSTAAQLWSRRLGPKTRRRIGLVWAGKSRPAAPGSFRTDRRRSFPLQTYAPLFEVPGNEFFSLQKDLSITEGGAPAPALPIVDYPSDCQDFLDNVPLIANLDLVITVDTSIAHLAGAMGKPVWVLSRYDACWRWLLDREDSPWYPTLRLFRQPTPGDWASVIAKVEQALTRASAA